MLGPIYRNIDHYVAPYFPALLVIPAFAIDLLHSELSKSNRILKVAIFGVCFSIIFFVVQWYFAEFLLSEHANNWFFASDNNKPYWIKIGEHENKFWFQELKPYGQKIQMKKVTFANFGLLTVFTITFCYMGSFFGSWIRKIKR